MFGMGITVTCCLVIVLMLIFVSSNKKDIKEIKKDLEDYQVSLELVRARAERTISELIDLEFAFNHKDGKVEIWKKNLGCGLESLELIYKPNAHTVIVLDKNIKNGDEILSWEKEKKTDEVIVISIILKKRQHKSYYAVNIKTNHTVEISNAY